MTVLLTANERRNTKLRKLRCLYQHLGTRCTKICVFNLDKIMFRFILCNIYSFLIESGIIWQHFWETNLSKLHITKHYQFSLDYLFLYSSLPWEAVWFTWRSKNRWIARKRTSKERWDLSRRFCCHWGLFLVVLMLSSR